ncbi:MAG: M14 family metallopeptidase [Acidobacteriota bacterium]
MKKLLTIPMLLLFMTAFTAAQISNRPVTVPLTFDYYCSNEQVVEALKALNKAYPKLTRLDLVGKSDEGREIYSLVVHNPETGEEHEKPGVYVDGNIHGNEIQAGEVALYMLNYLLTKYESNSAVKEIVDRNVFYVIPVLNVDGRYHFFADANTPSSNRSVRLPFDDDRDGLVDEDYPDDLDEDGSIRQMRKKDPHGEYRLDPGDPRVMVRVNPGEKGEWTLLGLEGIDNDGDGQVNEDSEGYTDGNRNWGYDWMPRYVQGGAGEFPFQSASIRAAGEYIRSHPNISTAFALHNSGGMYLRPPSSPGMGNLPMDDIGVYDYLGAQNERMVPGYRYLISGEDLYISYGDFVNWMMGCNGIYAWVPELYMVGEEETFKSREEEKQVAPAGSGQGRDNPERDKERLAFSDHLTQGELYKDWEPFNHPVYGEIEIGGWTKFSSRMPPIFLLRELLHRNAMAIIFSAKNTPKVSLEVFDVKKTGEGLWQVRTRLENSGAIPTMSTLAEKRKLFRKDSLEVYGDRARVIAGGELKNPYTGETGYKEFKPEVQLLRISGFGKVEHQFIISGSGEVTFEYESNWGGKQSATVELK